MPDTAFAAWQDRTGLVRAVDAARALNLTREAIRLLRNGDRSPKGSTLRLMEVMEDHPEIISRTPQAG